MKQSATSENNAMQLTLELNGNSGKSVVLSEKVKGLLEGVRKSIVLDLIIPENQTITLIDDTEHLNVENITLTIMLAKNSTLDYRLKVLDTPRTHLADTQLVSKLVTTIPKLQKKLHFKFLGEQSYARIHCSYLVGNKRFFKLVTIQDHLVPRTKSDLVIKGVFEGEAEFFCDNLIRISEGAQQVEAFQVNKNLLLSEMAKAVSIPKL